MKVKITIVVFALLSIVMFFFFNIKYPYKENVLYSQNDIKNYDEKQSKSSNLINRDEAIKIAKYYIEDRLGNDLDSDDNKMYVNLYRNDSNADSYYWNISWSRPNLSCGVEINTINKQINNIYVNKNFDWNNNKSESLLLSQNEVLEIANTLIVALGFDLDTYKLDAQHVNFSDEGYQICTFINKNNREDRFAIYISPTEKYIARYVRNP